jgi:hypothetical protein
MRILNHALGNFYLTAAGFRAALARKFAMESRFGITWVMQDA